MDICTREIKNITITPEILKLIAEIDEFKGRWKVMESLAQEKLTTLRRIATIESVGSSTRIEGAKLSDREVEKLLSGVKAKPFASRDEQEVAGYADAMDLVFDGFESITITENHIMVGRAGFYRWLQMPAPVEEEMEVRALLQQIA